MVYSHYYVIIIITIRSARRWGHRLEEEWQREKEGKGVTGGMGRKQGGYTTLMQQFYKSNRDNYLLTTREVAWMRGI